MSGDLVAVHSLEDTTVTGANHTEVDASTGRTIHTGNGIEVSIDRVKEKTTIKTKRTTINLMTFLDERISQRPYLDFHILTYRHSASGLIGQLYLPWLWLMKPSSKTMTALSKMEP
eukprot:NODE_534_length_1387_cov_176.414286_g499_i0.p1 GENE.NODE_534_length_1387_cov_176.414286_g499_i0~~NODE_534_length_1387_cov_176.414286_g499_i0.p1  ORF type:complete len:116 (+),score=23.54 NODE_534_length_1387_cov_176.414286_g499_i0:935-1282(+)